ncbi:hypothetical protein BT67DRAFT_437439 [Trichocladium antarcticum]|uniref:Uncharacterized protein n=1 Tax=Trichocladium antarcticum TaxID=1450529 RepID=A0AAN6Z9I9_9PEZI|nr:hypothetical protein BT67DRAFT_437439 [Trichocladium antarcticum]
MSGLKGAKGNPKNTRILVLTSLTTFRTRFVTYTTEELNLLKFKRTSGKVNIKATLSRKITRKAISYKHYLYRRAKLEKAKKSLEEKFKAKKRALGPNSKGKAVSLGGYKGKGKAVEGTEDSDYNLDGSNDVTTPKNLYNQVDANSSDAELDSEPSSSNDIANLSEKLR